MSGYITKGKQDPSRSLQMMERPLMTPDELRAIPKGHFVVLKTGTHPMQTRLRLFLDWGITFGEPYTLPERAARQVAYADKQALVKAICAKYPPPPPPPPSPKAARSRRPEHRGGKQANAQAPSASQERMEPGRRHTYILNPGGPGQ